MRLIPPPLLLLLTLALPTLSHASPSPALISDPYAQSLVPLHTLFLRQLSDLQIFDQALGGARASPITNSGDAKRPFSVDGSTFDKFEQAAQRSCDGQFQKCQGVANGNANGGGSKEKHRNRDGDKGGKDKRQNGGITVQQCDEQKCESCAKRTGLRRECGLTM